MNGHFLDIVIAPFIKNVKPEHAVCLQSCLRAVGCGCLCMETFCALPKHGLLLHRQLGVFRSNLTSSAGPLTSNTRLMADKLIGSGQAGQQMGTFYIQSIMAKK